ncbi:hypothetical protein ACGFW5_06265 [Streptomyces sp. NPDC048416]|uniref:hypothetical protein n=1 Tax=Streptomyces sp. NPDC048416 TaxID=3365546 RepID=UPI0037206936
MDRHGPDLGLGAHRAAVILNAVAGRTVHPLPARTAWTSFLPPGSAAEPRQEVNSAPAQAR